MKLNKKIYSLLLVGNGVLASRVRLPQPISSMMATKYLKKREQKSLNSLRHQFAVYGRDHLVSHCTPLSKLFRTKSSILFVAKMYLFVPKCLIQNFETGENYQLVL